MKHLSSDEKKLYGLARKVHSVIVKKCELNSACYLLSFFIHKYSKEVLGIDTDVIVGWVNDGTWDGAGSHAWVEYNGKKIDVSLSTTADEDIYPTGDAIILDEILEKGQAKYTYYYELPETVINARSEIMNNVNKDLLQVMKAKDLEHQKMKRIAGDLSLIDDFFEGAPPTRKFEFLKMLVEQT